MKLAKHNPGMWVWKLFHRTIRIWKAGLAVALSWDAAKLLGSHHPFFAPLAAVLCLQVTVEDSIKKGLQRIGGIIVGVISAGLLTSVLKVHDWSIALIVCLGLGIAALFRWDSGTASQIGVTGLLLMTAAGGNPENYGLDRIVETFIGALAAILINMFVFPPNYTDEASTSIERAVQALSGHLADVSRWLRQGADIAPGTALADASQQLKQAIADAVATVEQALHATKFSPLVKRNHRKLMRQQDYLKDLREACDHLLEMQQFLLEWRRHLLMAEDERQAWAARFAAYADLIRGRGSGGEARAEKAARPPTKEILQRSLEKEDDELTKIFKGLHTYRDAR